MSLTQPVVPHEGQRVSYLYVKIQSIITVKMALNMSFIAGLST